NAGHDLSQANLGAFLAAVPGVLEVSIGHALVDEALYAGLDATVRAYLRILAKSSKALATDFTDEKNDWLRSDPSARSVTNPFSICEICGQKNAARRRHQEIVGKRR